jgi:cytidine deaminase
MSELAAEDAKLHTLAKGSRSRISAAEGAALRDETGRTYASANISLSTLKLSAIQAVVAQAAAAGSRGIETVVLVAKSPEIDEASVSAVRELAGEGIPILSVSDGSDDVELRTS